MERSWGPQGWWLGGPLMIRDSVSFHLSASPSRHPKICSGSLGWLQVATRGNQSNVLPYILEGRGASPMSPTLILMRQLCSHGLLSCWECGSGADGLLWAWDQPLYGWCTRQDPWTKSGNCQGKGGWGKELEEWEPPVATTVPKVPVQSALRHASLW